MDSGYVFAWDCDCKMVEISGRKFHFIGIGGIGMSGLAKLLIKNGAIVSGSDQENSAVVERLGALGAKIQIGHRMENIEGGIEFVVISAAIKEANEELAFARVSGCEVFKYAEMLGMLMDNYAGIAICGTHGKSTTSGWLSFVMEQGGERPNYIVGAEIPQLGGSSGSGESELFVAEACEYDRSFLNLRPKIAVILNIEQDHLDYYKDEDEIIETFANFSDNIVNDGVLVVLGDDKNVQKCVKNRKSETKCVTFGLKEDCNYTAKNIKIVGGLHEFDVYKNGAILGRTGISLAGEHNILNALAVVAAAVEAGMDAGLVLELLGRFTGIDRRLMLKACMGGITVVDDYAHHPTEIRASLQAIRQRFSPERILCIFQPHQYSRTRFLLDDFAESFKLADITVVPEIYFVRDTEESKEKVNARVLVDRIGGEGSEALFINSFDGIGEYLKGNVRDGDLVVTMGAGDVWKVADEYIQWLRENSKNELQS